LARYFPGDGTWANPEVSGSGPFLYFSSWHLIFERNGAISAVSFDLDEGSVLGAARPVLGDANSFPLSVSQNGTAAYLHWSAGSGRSLVRVNRDGVTELLVEQTEPEYRWPRLSQDGQRLAFGMSDINAGELSSVWVMDLESGRRNPLADAGRPNTEPVWSPDGDRVVYSSGREVGTDLYWQSSDGGGASEMLSEETGDQWATSFSLGRELLAFYNAEDIYVMSLDDGVSTLAIGGPGLQRGAQFSPDDRWLAYSSDHTGRDEVYVRPFPDLERVLTVSTDGGSEPVWSPDGRELFYRSGNSMITVSFTPESDDHVGEETILFDGEFEFDSTGDQSYDVFPSGQHFVMIQQQAAAAPRFRVVTGLLEEVARLKAVN